MRDLTPGEYGVLRDILRFGCSDLRTFRVNNWEASRHIDTLVADRFLMEDNSFGVMTPRGLVALCNSNYDYALQVYFFCHQVVDALKILLKRGANRTYTLSEVAALTNGATEEMVRMVLPYLVQAGIFDGAAGPELVKPSLRVMEFDMNKYVEDQEHANKKWLDMQGSMSSTPLAAQSTVISDSTIIFDSTLHQSQVGTGKQVTQTVNVDVRNDAAVIARLADLLVQGGKVVGETEKQALEELLETAKSGDLGKVKPLYKRLFDGCKDTVKHVGLDLLTDYIKNQVGLG